MSIDSAHDQLRVFLDYIKLAMKSYGNFCDHKLAIAHAFRRAFGFDLGKDVLILQWMKG